MPTSVSVTILVLLGIAGLWGMWAGWRHRGARTAAVVPSLPVVPAADDAGLGPATTPALRGIYVSSTVAGDWLERVVARDLGVRSSAVVQVFGGGIRIERQGAADVFIPADALRDARTEPGMAGKYVGGDGLVVLTWTPGAATGGAGAGTGGATGAALDTGIRLRRADERAVLLQAARALLRPAGHDRPAGQDQPAGTAATSTTATSTTATSTPGASARTPHDVSTEETA